MVDFCSCLALRLTFDSKPLSPFESFLFAAALAPLLVTTISSPIKIFKCAEQLAQRFQSFALTETMDARFARELAERERRGKNAEGDALRVMGLGEVYPVSNQEASEGKTSQVSSLVLPPSKQADRTALPVERTSVGRSEAPSTAGHSAEVSVSRLFDCTSLSGANARFSFAGDSLQGISSEETLLSATAIGVKRLPSFF
jgi:hypothetical protein